MLKQFMAARAADTTASTPEHWARTFARSTVMDEKRRRQMRRSFEWSLVHSHIPGGSRVLDAGCGFGEWVEVLNDAGYAARGIDYSEELISRLRSAYPHSQWIHGDIRRIPVPDHSFDAVVSWGVIEHDEAGPSAALREFARILKPGGVIIVTVPLDSKHQRDASPTLFPQKADAAFFQYAMTTEELAEELRRAGFRIAETGTIAGAALALMAPRTFLWTQTAGRLGSIVSVAGNLVASQFRRFHLMTYAVGRIDLSSAAP